MATSPRAQVVLDGDVGPLRQKLREATQGIQRFGKDGSSAMTDMLGPASALQGKLAGIATAIMSGAFAVFVKNSLLMQDEMSKSAQKAGVTTEQFSGMAYAASLADVSGEELTKTYAKLASTLIDAQQGQKQAAELFERLKLDPKNIKDADQLLLALSERFAAMPDPAAKTALAIDVFGEKLGPRLVPLLNQGREGIEALRHEAEQLGIVVTTEGGRMAEEFNDTMTKIGKATEGAAVKLSQSLLPSLQAVADESLEMSKTGEVWNGIVKAIQVVVETVLILGANVSFVLKSIGREIGALAAQAVALARLDFAGFRAISEAVKEDGVRARKELEEFEKKVMGKSGAGAFVGPPAPPAAGFQALPKTPTNTPQTKPAASSYMQYYELLLAEDKRALSILEAGREYSKERELAYWRSLLDNLQLTQADRVAILRKTSALEVEVAAKAAKEKTSLESERSRQAEVLAFGKLDAERAAARMQLELGHITKAQFLEMDVQYEQQRYEIQRAALAQRLQLLADDPTSSAVERERINTQQLELEQAFQAKRIEAMGAIAKESGSNGMFDGMGAAFTTGLDAMLNRTQTWGQALTGIFRSAGQSFITHMVTEPFGNWIATQARMLAVKLGFMTQEKAMDAAGSAAKVGIKASETGAVVAASAAQAGAGAAASQAGIPIVGPALALAAMAAIFAAVSGLGKGVKSARNGYDIPSGINPMTQLHEEEMVLPKGIANAFRGIAAGEVASGAGEGAGSLTLNAQGGEWLHVNDLEPALRKLVRDFKIMR